MAESCAPLHRCGIGDLHGRSKAGLGDLVTELEWERTVRHAPALMNSVYPELAFDFSLSCPSSRLLRRSQKYESFHFGCSSLKSHLDSIWDASQV